MKHTTDMMIVLKLINVHTYCIQVPSTRSDQTGTRAIHTGKKKTVKTNSVERSILTVTCPCHWNNKCIPLRVAHTL